MIVVTEFQCKWGVVEYTIKYDSLSWQLGSQCRFLIFLYFLILWFCQSIILTFLAIRKNWCFFNQKLFYHFHLPDNHSMSTSIDQWFSFNVPLKTRFLVHFFMQNAVHIWNIKLVCLKKMQILGSLKNLKYTEKVLFVFKVNSQTKLLASPSHLVIASTLNDNNYT